MGAYGGSGACNVLTKNLQLMMLYNSLSYTEVSPGDVITMFIDLDIPDGINLYSAAIEIECPDDAVDITQFYYSDSWNDSDWIMEYNLDNCPISIWGAGTNPFNGNHYFLAFDITIDAEADSQFVI